MHIKLLTLTAALLLSSEVTAQDPDYRILGSPDAPVEMSIYSDFECPYCRNLALVALPAVIAEFVDPGLLRIRYVYFPLAGLHKNAVAAAKAAHCAGQAGRFWSFHDYIYVRQPEWAGTEVPEALWYDYAANLGMDPERFADCMGSQETHRVIETDLREALGFGATGTPTVVLGGESITGAASYEELRRQILAALEAGGG
jgi:protein-disulfide isomerase